MNEKLLQLLFIQCQYHSCVSRDSLKNNKSIGAYNFRNEKLRVFFKNFLLKETLSGELNFSVFHIKIILFFVVGAAEGMKIV